MSSENKQKDTGAPGKEGTPVLYSIDCQEIFSFVSARAWAVMSEDVVALCLIGFQPGFTKIAANATGMYVSMKSGNVKIEKIFLATPAWMFFHSVTVVIPPKTMRSAHALKIVSHIDQIFPR